MITRKDFESGKLSLLDAESYVSGLRPSGQYGKSPEIDIDLAMRNYPVLFCGKIEDISYREPARNVVDESRLGEWTVDLAIEYLRDGPNVSPGIARTRLSKFRDSGYAVPEISKGTTDIVRLYNDSVADIIRRARSPGDRPN